MTERNDDHIDIWRAETQQDWATKHWLNWIRTLEQRIGHSLDGDQDTDGYSLDQCHELWLNGHTVSHAYHIINATKKEN